MASVADCDEGRARAAALKILSTFQASPQQQEQHHRLTWVWLREGTCIRQQLEEFITGDSLDTLHDLRRLLNQLCLIPTAERRQDGDHGISRRYLHGSWCSGPCASLALRFPSIECACSTQEGSDRFAKHVSDLMQSPRFWVKALGLAKHPLIATCLAQPGQSGAEH